MCIRDSGEGAAAASNGKAAVDLLLGADVLYVDEHVFAALRGEHVDVLYDTVRRPMWRGHEATESESA